MGETSQAACYYCLQITEFNTFCSFHLKTLAYTGCQAGQPWESWDLHFLALGGIQGTFSQDMLAISACPAPSLSYAVTL